MKLKLRELVLFALLGTLMFCSKLLTEIIPNVHFLALLTVVYTVTFRAKALMPIYVFVFMTGLFNGFAMWWLPYLYIWAVLWGAVMLLPKNMPTKVAMPVYIAVAAAHGLLYGTLYAPAQALMYGYSLEQTLTWIVIGLPWDAVHALGNLLTGTLALPLIKVMKTAKKQMNI